MPRKAQRGGQSNSESLTHATDSDGRSLSQPRPETIVVHHLDDLLVQRNDRLRMLVIGNNWIQLSTLEYLFLLPLLQNFGQYVSSATLLQVVYGSSYEPREARRLAKLVYRLRSKLAPHDLTIDTVIGTSYQAWGYILQRIPPATVVSSTWPTIQPTSHC